MKRLLGLLVAAVGVVVSVQPSQTQNIPQGFAASNFQVVGYSEIDGRPGSRWRSAKSAAAGTCTWAICGTGDGPSSTSPTRPSRRSLKFVPGPENTWSIQMDLHDNIMITGLEQVSRRWGGDPSKPHDEGFLIWDIKDPVNPKKLGQWKTGGRGTHRNGYPGGRYVYAAAALPGYQDELLVIVDIQDPAKPVEVARWSAPGQHVAAGEKPEDGMQVHGPPIVDGNRLYLDYGGAGMYILDISDIRKPTPIGHLRFHRAVRRRHPGALDPADQEPQPRVGELRGDRRRLPGRPRAGVAGRHLEREAAEAALDHADAGAAARRAVRRLLRQGRAVRAAQHQPPPAPARTSRSRAR